MTPQEAWVIDFLKKCGSITPIEAEDGYGIRRLASRISNLRKEGYNIVTKTETAKNRFGVTVSYARYILK